MSGKPLRNGNLLRDPHLVQLDAGAGKLLVCLDEITGIGPKARMVLRDDDIAGLAGETAHPFDLFPARSRILAAVGIRPRHNHSVITQLADLSDPLCKKIVILCHNRQR